jgi:hypothetical protein
MEQLIAMVVEKTGISEEAAQSAVDVVVTFIKEKLPEPIAGQIDGLLSGDAGGEGEGGIGGALKGMLGS